MYRAIGSTVDQECINKLLSSLLGPFIQLRLTADNINHWYTDSVERMESILEKTITLAKNPKQTASKRFQTNETLISIYRGKSLEVLLTLQTIAPAVVEITTLRLIFWTAVTFLRSPVPPFAQLYHQALQVLLVYSKTYKTWSNLFPISWLRFWTKETSSQDTILVIMTLEWTNKRHLFLILFAANFDSTAQILSKIQITSFKGIQPLLFQVSSSRPT